MSDSNANEERDKKVGRINADIIATLIDTKSINFSSFCCVCGPIAFNDFCLKLLTQAGFKSDDLHLFNG